MKTGSELIAEERERQLSDERHLPQNDDLYTDNQLARAAESYLVAVTSPDEEGDDKGKARPDWDWPWHNSSWKPGTDVRNLVKAGALIAAEIDRRLRAGEKP